MPKNQNTIPNISTRYSNERGRAKFAWLDSYHTFSFGEYYDAKYMGFRTLRVINEDRLEAGQGFGAHPHQDMEILSYVIEGELKHKDSMGHESVIRPGEVQKISAGTGIVHSEYNASTSAKVHFLQIWIVPDKSRLKPSYQQFTLPKPDNKNPLLLIASPQGGKEIVRFNQDVLIFRGNLTPGKSCAYTINPGHGLWLQMVMGEVQLNDSILSSGDGAAVENLNEINISAKSDSEFLLFDLK